MSLSRYGEYFLKISQSELCVYLETSANASFYEPRSQTLFNASEKDLSIIADRQRASAPSSRVADDVKGLQRSIPRIFIHF